MAIKSSLVQSIKSDTEKIAKNTKHFGPKLPSKDESSDRNQQLNDSLSEIVQMIVGSFAQLVFGASGKSKPADLFNLVNKSPKDTIFGNISDIANAFGADKGRTSAKLEMGKQLAAGFADNTKYWTEFTNSIKSGVSSSLTDSNIIGLMEILNGKIDSKLNTEQLANEINIKLSGADNMGDLIRLLSQISNIQMSKQTFNNLKFIKYVTSTDGPIQAIFDNMSALNINAQKLNVASDGLTAFNELLYLLQNLVYNDFNADDVADGLDNITYMVKNELNDLMIALDKDLTATKQFDKFDAIQFNIEQLVSISNLLPDWVKLFSMMSKMSTLLIYTNTLIALSKYINSIPKSTMSKSDWDDLSQNQIPSLSQIGLLLSNIDAKKYSKEINANTRPYIKDIITLLNDIEKFNKFKLDLSKLKHISDYLNEFNQLPFDKLPKQAELIKILEVENIINEFVKNFKGDAFAASEDVDVMLTNIRALVMEFSAKGEIGKYFPQVIDITKNDVDKLAQMGEYFITLGNVAKKLAVIDNLMTKIDDPASSGIAKLADTLKVAVEKFQSIDIDEQKVKLLNKTMQTFMQVVATGAAVLLFSGLVMLVVPVVNIALFATTLGVFMYSMLKIYKSINKEVGLSFESAQSFALLVAMSAEILLAAGFLMNYINPVNIIEFGIIEATFVFGLSFIYKKFNEDIKLSLDGAKGFSILLATAGATLIFGSMLISVINWKDILSFVTYTSLFTLSFVFIYFALAVSDLMKNAKNGMKDFTTLIVMSAATTVLGSMLFSVISWKDVIGFVTSTALFALSMVVMFGAPRMLGTLFGDTKWGAAIAALDPFQAALKGVKDFAILIAATGLTLALGALISQSVSIGDLLAFAFSVSVFMLMTVAPLIAMNGSLKIAEKSGKEFGRIIAISAATLIVGGLLFTWFPGIRPGVIEFGIVFGGFMLVMSTAFWLFGKMNSNRLLKNATILMITTVVCGAVLLYAGKIMQDNPEMVYTIPVFTICLAGYILAIGITSKLLNKIKGNLIKGLLGIGLIAIITIASAYALDLAASLAKKYSWKTLGKGILELIAGIGAIGLAYWAMGYAAFIDGGIGLGLATVALGLISGLTFLTVSALSYMYNNQSKFDTKVIDKFKTTIKEFASLGKEVVSEFTGWWVLKLPFVSSSIKSLSVTLSSIARTIEEYANLKVAIYEGTKIVGYRQLSRSDFREAAKNVSSVISTLGGAVIQAYDKNPEIFEIDLFGRSKFSKVTKSLSTLGPMLASIATAVKTYANLIVGTDYKKNDFGILVPTKYRQLTSEDFINASNNVKEIITTLGNAIIETYDKNPGIFETNLFGTSKFAKVTKSMRTLAPLISSIAKSVKTYADLKVADYGDTVKYVDGKPQIQRYVSLGQQDFDSAAQNISTIMSTLGGAIIKAYDEHPEYYDSSLFVDSKFAKTVKANMTLAKLISNIAQAVGNMSNLTVVTEWYTEGENIGKAKSYKHLNETDFENASKAIMKILTTLGEPIQQIANDSKLFELYNSCSGFLGIGKSKSKFAKVIDGNIKLAEMIGKISKAVYSVAIMRIPTKFDNSGNAIDWRPIDKKDFTQAGINVTEILNALKDPIKGIINSKDFPLFEESSGLFSNKKSKFAMVVDGNLKLGEAISKIAKAVKDISSLNMPIQFDSKGNPIKYASMKPEDIAKAGTSIKDLLTSIGNAVVTTIEGNEKIFGDKNLFFGTNPDPKASPAYRAAIAITEITKPIATMANLLAYYSTGQFPYVVGTDRQGRPVTRLMGKAFNPTNVKKNIKNVLLAIVTPLHDLINNKDVNDVFEQDGDKTLGSLRASQIVAMANQMNALVKEITTLSSVTVGDSTKKLATVRGTITNMLIEVAALAKVFGTPIETLKKESVFGTELKTKTLGQYMQEMLDNGTIDSTADGINSIVESVISICNDIKSLSTFYNKNKTILETFVNSNSVNNSTIEKAITSMANIMSSTINEFNKTEFNVDEFDEKQNQLIEVIRKTSNVFMHIDTMYKMYEKSIAKLNGKNDFSNLENVIKSCRNAIAMLYDYTGTNTATQEFGTPFTKYVNEVSSKVNINDLSRQLNEFNFTVKRLIDIVSYSDRTGSTGYDIIVNGLDGLITKIGEIPEEDNFKTHVELLERYVKAVNRIDLSKLISLNNLGITLNTLATKMGNLDRLTEALATKIATVLDRLVVELKNAEKTITKADVLQKRRHALIAKATKEVKSIMDQKMLVEIRQVQDDTSPYSTGGGGGYSPSSSENDSSNQSTEYDSTNSFGGNSEYQDKNSKDSKAMIQNIATTGKQKHSNGGSNNGNGSITLYQSTIENAIIKALRKVKHLK